MKPLTLFQRSLLMLLYVLEQANQSPVAIQRRAIEYRLQFKWQNHYTIATNELQEAGWITIHNYFGSHEYSLTPIARQQLESYGLAASRGERIIRKYEKRYATMFDKGGEA